VRYNGRAMPTFSTDFVLIRGVNTELSGFKGLTLCASRLKAVSQRKENGSSIAIHIFVESAKITFLAKMMK
jgi:hypothetical protein